MESEIGLQDNPCLFLTKLCNCKEFASFVTYIAMNIPSCVITVMDVTKSYVMQSLTCDTLSANLVQGTKTST